MEASGREGKVAQYMGGWKGKWVGREVDFFAYMTISCHHASQNSHGTQHTHTHMQIHPRKQSYRQSQRHSHRDNKLVVAKIWGERKQDAGVFLEERWGAGVETPKNVRGEIGGWGRVPFNETCAPSLSTIYDGA